MNTEEQQKKRLKELRFIDETYQMQLAAEAFAQAISGLVGAFEEYFEVTDQELLEQDEQRAKS